MNESRHPFDQPPDTVFLILDEDSDAAKRARLLRWLEAVLPHFNWRSHLFMIPTGHEGTPAAARGIVEVASRFVEHYDFTTLYAHVPVHMRPSAEGREVEWEQLVAPARLFQNRAYELLTEARLHVSPIIAPSLGLPVHEALAAAEFFSSRLAIPAFYLPGGMLEGLVNRTGYEEIRFFLDPDRSGLAVQLWMSHVLETVLDRLDGNENALLAPCRRHVVVDEESGGLFSCFKLWEAGQPSLFFDCDPQSEPELPDAPVGVDCPGCIGRSALCMQENLCANNRRQEGRQAYAALALAFTRRNEDGLAALLAHKAYDLSDSDQDRCASLVHEGLCLRNAREFKRADDALRLAGEYAEDSGFVTYHRGKVQFEWGDPIEALKWFEEALASGSRQVPIKDLCFEMALSHIQLEEYKEARGYLERSLKPAERESPVSFYLGICDLAEGAVERAMGHFSEALALDPAEEDLSRVLFYIGTCLKEMERFEDAIDVLKRAVAADPEDILNHNLLGLCHYKLGRHRAAVACFERAVEIDPRSAIDWASLGSNLRDLGRIDDAIAAYRKALSLDPTIGFARENLVKLARER